MGMLTAGDVHPLPAVTRRCYISGQLSASGTAIIPCPGNSWNHGIPQTGKIMRCASKLPAASACIHHFIHIFGHFRSAPRQPRNRGIMIEPMQDQVSGIRCSSNNASSASWNILQHSMVVFATTHLFQWFLFMSEYSGIILTGVLCDAYCSGRKMRPITEDCRKEAVETFLMQFRIGNAVIFLGNYGAFSLLRGARLPACILV